MMNEWKSNMHKAEYESNLGGKVKLTSEISVLDCRAGDDIGQKKLLMN